MNISENIRWIMEKNVTWELFTNKSYPAKIQKANPEKIYNVPDQPGVVYNFLEDAYEKTGSSGYVITGIAGEMWVIGAGALKKYSITEENITDEPQTAPTKETGTIMAGIRIPEKIQFTLETDYGEKALLKGNRPGINHDAGDYILVAVKEENGAYIPDFSDSGRIVNGAVFEKLYKPVT